jgi:hypothetical protein
MFFDQISIKKLNLKSMIKNSNRNINKNVVKDLFYKKINKLEKKNRKCM